MKNTKRIFQLCLLPMMGLGLGACTGGSGGGSSLDSLDVSGILSLGNSSQSFEKAGQFLMKDDAVSSMSVDITAYKVACATTTPPIQSATASIAADGAFTVSLPGAKGQPLSCYLVDVAGDKIADFIIADSSKKDLNGNDETSTTAAFKSNANLGTISFDPNAGEVTVPKSNIASVVDSTPAAAAQVFDPTGAWTISAVDFTLPKGVTPLCSQNDNSCKGPPAGQSIYLKLWKGLVTADSSDIFGLQVWEGSQSFQTCGSKIGLTSDVKTSLGVDFSANGSADSAFTFATSVTAFQDQVTSQTGDVNLTDGWKMSTAKLLHQINPSCAPRDVTVGGVVYSNTWFCGPDSNSRYQANLGGGCVNSSGTPVEVNDWSGVNQCSSSADSNNIKTSTCSGTASVGGQATAVTCTHKWAVTDNTYAVVSQDFNWNDLSGSNIAENTACSAIGTGTEALKMAQLQCYAEYYYRSGMERANACLPRVDMDWSASTAVNFAIVDKIRPQGLIFFEKYSPFPDGSGGSLMTREEHYEGVSLSGNNWVNCRVIETGGLTIKKVSDTKLLATYQSSTITTSTSKPACVAKFNGARESFMFYLSK